MSRTARWAALCAALLLLTAPSAPASIRVGSTLSAPPDVAGVCGDCTFIALSTEYGLGAPLDGVVVRWRARFTNAGTQVGSFKVLRRDPAGTIRAVGSQAVTFGASTLPTFAARVPIRRGDLIGLYSPKGVPMTQRSGISRWSFAGEITESGVSTNLATYESDQDVLIAADVEPDADRDGYGDETQDLCPTDGQRQGACSGVLVGPDLLAETGNLGLNAPAVVVDAGSTQVPSDGVIVRWRARAFDGVLAAVLLRPAGGGAYRHAGETPFSDPFPFGASSVITTTPARLPVQAGDRLGVRGGSFSLIATRSGVAGADLRRFNAGLAPGATATPSAAPAPAGTALLVGYDLEPDADRDGFGDLTQDGCPTDASRQGACAAPPPGGGDQGAPSPSSPPSAGAAPSGTVRVERVLVEPGTARLAAARLRYRGARSLPLTLTCPSEAWCRGTVEVRRGKARVGRATFRLRAGERRVIAVRLAPAARRVVRRGGRLDVTITPSGAPPRRGQLTVIR